MKNEKDDTLEIITSMGACLLLILIPVLIIAIPILTLVALVKYVFG